jgi:glyoxylase-like metal-dependent hydrolase (beta-lactamase superfamily II)
MRITEHIHALKIPFKITIAPGTVVDRFVYVYLICAEETALIDTGVSGADKIIFNYLEKIGRKPEEISNIFLTHSHPDHIGSAGSIKKATGCSVAVHSAERAWVEDVELQYSQRPVPGFQSLVGGSVPVDHALEGGEVINLGGGMALEVFHTPGHSKGSVSFFLKADNALFCGDALLLPRQMPIFEDFRGSLDSVNKLKKIYGAKALFSSWDDPREGRYIPELMDASSGYLGEIQRAVKAAALEKASLDPMEFCGEVVSRLGLSNAMANPLVARSFRSILE